MKFHLTSLCNDPMISTRARTMALRICTRTSWQSGGTGARDNRGGKTQRHMRFRLCKRRKKAGAFLRYSGNWHESNDQRRRRRRSFCARDLISFIATHTFYRTVYDRTVYMGIKLLVSLGARPRVYKNGVGGGGRGKRQNVSFPSRAAAR